MSIDSANPPPGFHPYYRDDLFYNAVGPMFVRLMGGKLQFGFRVLEKHANAAMMCHGGMLVTLIDMQIGLAACIEESIDAFLPTINITTDFVAPAHIGDWVEAHSRVVRRTRKMVFCDGTLEVDGAPILRANGIVKIPSKSIGQDEFLKILPPEYVPQKGPAK